MASWSDYVSLTLTVALLAAALYCVLYLRAQIHKGIVVSKDKLRNKGIDVSAAGAHVKTRSKLADREAYMDATQRGVIKALSKASVSRGSEPARSRHASRTSRSSVSSNKSPKMS
ncbi:hypothetical protein PHLGIDRAFT_17836 [Phlebiopsis gigantea 11061_1 CR5-6]|uniref:Uncharacterized protein n=1 Tax=Phlebiopsis gigantea (strain 11061_1 CR5-6) TaxID=745531 RepID=A0A0C3PVF3_PHLG1|nr:hypothetical protein PHLGIDRAFT_17836 [Phlebiopsis gigantea 11061_1 CR5-6]